MHPTIGTYTLCLNEAFFMGPHLESWLPHVDQMVLFDGGSTDGTIEIVRHFQKHHRSGDKIKFFEGKNPADLKDDYVRVFNECIHSLDTDLVVFAHIDMILSDPGNLRAMPQDTIAGSIRMVSYAGDPEGPWYEISGRASAWKNIARLNPDLGLHYHGWYGAQNEDTYFSAITGDSHEHHGEAFDQYPYHVADSGAIVRHFSDVRPYARRLDRMRKCLLNQGYAPESVDALAKSHPRVTLQKGNGFEFHPVPVLETEIKERSKRLNRESWSVNV